jgi:hypothetical protein
MIGRTRFLGLVLVGVALAACSAQQDDGSDEQGAMLSSSGARFDRNDVLSDEALNDKDAMSVSKIQEFLEKTPYDKRSVLADYEENGKSAAEILHASSLKYGINPLVMLVRLQMEQGLIAKTTASTYTLSIAFGCGCPHATALCNGPNGASYRGFANQSECAAGTLRRQVDKASTPKGTISGWKVAEPKRTSDGISVTPKNGATAALYTYTPWVGQAGGGKQGVGGASLHWQIWSDFADKAGYGTSGADQPATQVGAGGADEPAAPVETPPVGTGGADQPAPTPTPTPTHTPTPDPKPTPTPDPTPTATPTPAPKPTPAPTPAPTPTPAPPSLGSDDATPPAGQSAADDSQVVGNETPRTSENAPPRTGVSTRNGGSATSSSDDADAPLGSSAKKASSGCSTTGATGAGAAGNGLLVLGAVFASVLRGRRKSR